MERYGDQNMNVNDAVSVAQVPELLTGNDSVQVKLEGTISEVCQKKGCWMQMPITEDQNLFVKFKDYAFFVPMNSAERDAVIEGYAYVDTVSVEQRRHYASDAGKSEEEIMAITEPEVQYTFKASGVILK